MRFIILLLALILTFPVVAQKKVVPASKSAFTGITLPAGTMEDKRLLSTVAAALFLEDESKKVNVKITTAEVFQLPPNDKSGFSADKLKEALRQAGWNILPVEGAADYGWLQKAGRYLLFYFAADSKGYTLYFGEADTAPVFAVNESPANAPQTNVNTPAALPTAQKINTENSATPAASITGTWYKSSATSGNTAYGYIKCQYSLHADGTYVFYRKTFDVYTPQMILRKETGRYIVSENTLTINPTTSAVQTWSKKDNADKWGSVIKSETISPEKTTYNIRFHSFGEKQNMLLSPVNSQPTNRDGQFGINSEFPNTYFYEIPPDESYLIELPDAEQVASVNTTTKPKEGTVTPVSAISGFPGISISTTNFDDGWVAQPFADYVRVSKGQITVLLHYAIKITDQIRDSNDVPAYLFDMLMQPRYTVSNIRKYDNGGPCYFCIYFYEADVIEKSTNKKYHAGFRVLIESGIARCVEILSPSAQDFQKEFPTQEKIAAMTGYNKFAVSQADLIGEWDESTGAYVNMYSTVTGAYAGMNSSSSANKFIFKADGTYFSNHKGAFGMVGSMQFYDQKYNGNYTVTNWDITATKRFEGKTDVWWAQFEAVRGGCVLHLQDKVASGMQYHLMKAN